VNNNHKNHRLDNIPYRPKPKPNITLCRAERAALTIDNYQLTIIFVLLSGQ
jgi:hypothetical protein